MKLFGGSYDIYDKEGDEILYSHQKEFKLKEDFTVYDKDKTTPLLTIKSPQILDIAGVFHVQDPPGNKVGSLKRKWLKSIFRDEWLILDQDGVEIGKLAEASKKRAFFSRLFGWLVPQRYAITTKEGEPAASLRQHFNPIVLSYSMDINQSQTQIDPRLLIASGILLSAVEKRQGSWLASALDVASDLS